MLFCYISIELFSLCLVYWLLIKSFFAFSTEAIIVTMKGGRFMEDATYWAEQLTQKKISFSELTARIEEKIQQVEPTLNALVSFDRQAAIKQYEQNPQTKAALFSGLPIPLKILGQSKAGWPATSAAALFANAKQSRRVHLSTGWNS